MSAFAGFVDLEQTLPIIVVTAVGATPQEAAALPTYRVYNSAGLMANMTGSLAKLETGTITGASNASPVVITSAGHGLTTGQSVTLSGVGGNAGANGTFQVTVLDANSFSLNGSTGTGAYTSGGTWHTTGLYATTLTIGAANGFQQGQSYTVLVQAQVSNAAWADELTFPVS